MAEVGEPTPAAPAEVPAADAEASTVAASELKTGYGQVDPLFMANLQLRRRNFDRSIDIATNFLNQHPFDQAMWSIKTRALTEKVYIDDTEFEEESLAEQMMDENAIASLPRPGTSFQRPLTSRPGTASQGNRPMTGSGRPLSGYARPGTQSRPGTGMDGGYRPGTARPVTQASGRFVRLGTASMVAEPGGPFIPVDRLDLRKYAARPSLSKALYMYIMHVENKITKALELASLAHKSEEYQDWWWKAEIGKCYYRLGLLRDAEKFLKSSLKTADMVATYLSLAKVYLRLDQPVTAREVYLKGSERHPGETSLITGVARVYDALNDVEKSTETYRKVLEYNAANVEAIACLGSHHFYNDQPEIALRFYRRLLQMGVYNTEIWNNVGLCCFYAQQYDMALGCMEKALALASDDNMGDVWYNIGHVQISIGDVGLAYQAFKLAVACDPHHAEAFSNLGVLELFRGNSEQGRSEFRTATNLAPFLHEPLYNLALLQFKMGDFQDSFRLAKKALENYPEHEESKELLEQLAKHFCGL